MLPRTTCQAAVGALCVAATVGLASTPAQGRDLVYGSWVSPKHGINQFALPPFISGIEKDTGGAVKWKLVAGGQLVGGNTTLQGIRDGIVDAGLVIPSYTPRELGGNNLVMGVQVFGEDTVAASAAAAETVMLNCAECQADFRKQNAVYLAGHAASPFYLMCRPEVASLADVAGKRVRSSGTGNRLVQVLGGVPTPMPPSEAVTAMERGGIDCVLGSIAWLESYGFQDVVTTVLDYPLGIVGALGTFVMNRPAWDGLSVEQKKAHFAHLPMLSSRAVIKAYVEEDARIARQAQAKGIKFIKGGREFDDAVARFEKAEQANLVATAKRLGVKEPEPILEAFRRNLKKWQALSKSIGADEEKYARALKTEIYDKIDPAKY